LEFAGSASRFRTSKISSNTFPIASRSPRRSARSTRSPSPQWLFVREQYGLCWRASRPREQAQASRQPRPRFWSGGSARAVAFALARAGAQVSVCARRESAARELARAVGGEAVPRRALRTETFDGILNTTPVGMYPQENVSPLSAQELRCNLVMDLIYRPLETRLLKIAKKNGIATVSGLEMFLAQGFAQWEVWTTPVRPNP